jgi:hypothetical protein
MTDRSGNGPCNALNFPASGGICCSTNIDRGAADRYNKRLFFKSRVPNENAEEIV